MACVYVFSWDMSNCSISLREVPYCYVNISDYSFTLLIILFHLHSYDTSYCRFYLSESGDTRNFEQLPAQRSCSYKLRFEDIGRCLRCECIVTDVFGRSSEPVYAETAPILPGISNAVTRC